jgi:hypothetical protein
MRPSHREIDAQNELKDRLLARRLRRNGRLLRLAQSNLRRWKARDGKRSRPAFVEWQRILDHLSAKEIADFLVSDTPMARRLRQSSPFLGSSPRPAGPRGAGEKARTENRPQGGGARSVSASSLLLVHRRSTRPAIASRLSLTAVLREVRRDRKSTVLP